MAVALPLAVVCLTASWSPSKYVPTEADRDAAEKLITRLRTIDGEVWMPSHPWYVRLANNRTPRVHRMGITDVTWRQPQNTVDGLALALQRRVFAAIVLDSRDLQNDPVSAQLRANYRPMLTLPPDERPHVYSGAGTPQSWGGLSTPDSIWLPIVTPRAPAGAKTLFDFENAQWAGGGWDKTGTAWGNGPVTTSLPGQGLVFGPTGARFATSMHGGDDGIGRLSTPPFAIEADKITMRLGGGTDGKLRVELWVDDQIVATTGVPKPGGNTLREVSFDVTKLRGKTGKLTFVDDTPTGHMDVDDVWAW